MEAAKTFLDEFTNGAGLSVIIKGTIAKPYCKYTKHLVAALSNANLTVKREFNIFDNSRLRYYIPKVNGWPTYPMIYDGKKLIGGLDKFIDYLKSEALAISHSTSLLE